MTIERGTTYEDCSVVSAGINPSHIAFARSYLPSNDGGLEGLEFFDIYSTFNGFCVACEHLIVYRACGRLSHLYTPPGVLRSMILYSDILLGTRTPVIDFFSIAAFHEQIREAK